MDEDASEPEVTGGGVMSPSELREALDAVRWSQRSLASALECDDRLVRRWAAGGAAVPQNVAVWLRRLAAVHRVSPPPQAWRSLRLGAEAD